MDFLIKIRFSSNQNIKETLFYIVLITGDSNIDERNGKANRGSFLKK
jgi:hypothetical protein